MKQPGDLRTAIVVFAIAEAAALTAFVVYVLLAK
jgi:F0F1-type ATP synthase membrane subunit c/vacuolar-type H+-ATPase subunit K